MEGNSPVSQVRTLHEVQRRVLGVLVEKAKTTPEQYPLTLNSLTTGCNQKSNRAPQMNLDTDEVQICLDELRSMHAVVEIQSGGRTAKYKHLLYDWLGVDKVELAVLAELLLRGAQTVGDLRGRASRMEPIENLTALQPILQSLQEKGLLVELTPAGRGQVVTHNLYRADELEVLQRAHRGGGVAAAPPTPSQAPPPSEGGWKTEIQALHEQLEQLRERVSHLESRLDA